MSTPTGTQAQLPPSREGEFTLPDGRRLTYGLYGADAGPLVVVLDGPGSRGLGRAAAISAAPLGLTLLVPDRPGFGGSARRPASSSFTGVADDLRALVASLGHQRFGIVAQSGGTPYGLALAGTGGMAVTGLAFVGAMSPLGEPDALQNVHGQMRTAFMLARRAPWALTPLLRLVARRTRKDPEAAARAYAKGLPEADRATLQDPQLWAIHVAGSAEALSSPAEFAREARMLAEPWQIDLTRITAPAAFWVGELDPTHPPLMSRRMAARVGGAPVTVVPGAATFAMVAVFPDVLRHAAGVARTGALISSG
jgi:pimeloyl-ACP methyl ester carboxylesterase